MHSHRLKSVSRILAVNALRDEGLQGHPGSHAETSWIGTFTLRWQAHIQAQQEAPSRCPRQLHSARAMGLD